MRDFAGNLSVYFEELYNTNKNLIELVGLDCIDNYSKMESLFLSISNSLMRLFPCKIDRSSNSLQLQKNDGVLALKDNLCFLLNDYQTLLNKHNDLLNSIRKIRNKAEHTPHRLSVRSTDSGTHTHPRIRFAYYGNGDNKEWSLNASALILLIVDLNKMFDKILGNLQAHIRTNHSDREDHPYYQRLFRLEYERFNRLLESPLLYDISKSMQNYW